MRNKRIYLSACCLTALLLAGCKTDEEPQWEAAKPGETPAGDNKPGEGTGDTADFRAIRLNELDGNKPKFIELYNTSAQAVDISGMKLRKNGDEMVYEAPMGTVIAAGGYLALLSDQTDYAIGFSAGFSAKKSVQVELLAPDGTVIDLFVNPSNAMGHVWDETDPKYNGDTTGEAYGRKPDGTGEWYMIKSTQGASNNQAATSDKITW
ncbi:MAG: lamin tail domain-containing protein [Bacteroidaceae bacterium]